MKRLLDLEHPAINALYWPKGGSKPSFVIDQKPKRSKPLLVRIGCSEAEAAQSSACSSHALSFELKVNETKLCIDCINRERLDFTAFVCSCIELFHISHYENDLVQMELPGL